MKYRAYLDGVEGYVEGAQRLSDSRQTLVDWAVKVLAGLKKEQQAQACVVVVECREVEVARLYPKQEKGEGG